MLLLHKACTMVTQTRNYLHNQTIPPDDGLGQLHMVVVLHIDSPGIEPLNLTNVSSLSLSIVNFRSSKNKQAELQAYLVVEHLNIILSTESHLHGSVLNSEIFPSHIVIVHANTFDSFKKLVYQYYNM